MGSGFESGYQAAQFDGSQGRDVAFNLGGPPKLLNGQSCRLTHANATAMAAHAKGLL